MTRRRSTPPRGAAVSRGGGPRKGRYLWAAGGARLFDPTGQEHTREFTNLTTSEVEECLAELPAMQVGVIECGAGVTFFEGRDRLEVWQDRIRAQLHDPTRDAPDVEWGYVAELWRDDTSGRQALIFNGE